MIVVQRALAPYQTVPPYLVVPIPPTLLSHKFVFITMLSCFPPFGCTAPHGGLPISIAIYPSGRHIFHPECSRGSMSDGAGAAWGALGWPFAPEMAVVVPLLLLPPSAPPPVFPPLLMEK